MSGDWTLMELYPIDGNELSKSLDQLGMICFGSFEILAAQCPKGSKEFAGKQALLIGNAGGEMWDVFKHSSEYGDGAPNPMDRWTKRMVDNLAKTFDLEALYPFGKPFWPFQKFAAAAAEIKSSPLGLLIHPEYGLWQAYRAVLVMDSSQEKAFQVNELFVLGEGMIHPCDECADKPCLTACPVNAFAGETLNVKSCREHLASPNDPDCMSFGCRARAACPIGRNYVYSPDQIQFHMRSFKSA